MKTRIVLTLRGGKEIELTEDQHRKIMELIANPRGEWPPFIVLSNETAFSPDAIASVMPREDKRW